MTDTVCGETKTVGTFLSVSSQEIQYLMPLVWLPLSSRGTFIEMPNKLSVLIFFDLLCIATVNNRIYTK